MNHWLYIKKLFSITKAFQREGKGVTINNLSQSLIELFHFVL